MIHNSICNNSLDFFFLEKYIMFIFLLFLKEIFSEFKNKYKTKAIFNYSFFLIRFFYNVKNPNKLKQNYF